MKDDDEIDMTTAVSANQLQQLFDERVFRSRKPLFEKMFVRLFVSTT